MDEFQCIAEACCVEDFLVGFCKSVEPTFRLLKKGFGGVLC